jgi:hypothetical protein
MGDQGEGFKESEEILSWQLLVATWFHSFHNRLPGTPQAGQRGLGL